MKRLKHISVNPGLAVLIFGVILIAVSLATGEDKIQSPHPRYAPDAPSESAEERTARDMPAK
jgi:hypothetical protein